MKNRILYLFCIVFVVFSCTPTKEKCNKTTLTGTISNPVTEYALLLTSDMAMMKGITKVDTAILDSNGHFSLTTEIPYEGFYTFRHGREVASIYLAKGAELALVLDTEEFDESLKFSGDGAEINNYLISKLLISENIDMHYSELYALDLEFFNNKIDSSKAFYENYFSNFKKEHANVSENFLKHEECNILFSWALKKVYYPWYHAAYAKIEKWDAGEDYYSFVKELDLNDDILLEVQEAYGFLNNIIYYFSTEVYNADSLKYANMVYGEENAKMKAIENNFTNQKIRNELAYGVMKLHISSNGIQNIDELYNLYKRLCIDTSYISKTNDQFVKWSPLQSGKPAPLFTCFDVEGKEVSLSDFIGKNIYIDFWATWCRPCIAETPYFHDLKVKYQSENLVFLSISIDKDIERWKKFVADEKLDGIQLNPLENKKELASNYLISSIPRFVLIDKEGNIVNIKAPRPSSDKIKAELEKLQ